jgi:aerotaxis receptor
MSALNKSNGTLSGQEVHFPSGRYLVSKTDLDGKIIYANQTFIDISGYTEAELMGRPHNIVRHPIMPRGAFAHLWETIQQGLPWSGVVKNRCKNGDHYWVKAFVAPIRQNGAVTGYLSVRTEPSRQEVAAAETLYEKINSGQARLPALRKGLGLSFSTRLKLALGGMFVLAGGSAIAALLLLDPSPIAWGIAAANGVIGLLAAGLGIYCLTRMTTPLQQLADYFKRISEGNLTNPIDIGGRDETGVLFCLLAEMQANLLAMLDEIASAADTIGQRSTAFKEQMQQVEGLSSDQSDKARSVTRASKELTQSVGVVATNAEQTSAAVHQVEQLVSDSCRHIDHAMEIAGHVGDSMASAEKTLSDLSQAVTQISTVTEVISAIAAQTNLLALNAAIEAARAGESGRGFAVVADEVRNLAERTAVSTRDIAERIAAIQLASAQSVSEMEVAKGEITSSIDSLQVCSASLVDVAAANSTVTGLSSNISAATREQASASEDVAGAMETISTLIETNVSVFHAASESSEQLSAIARRLKTLTDTFTLR